jgi:predicted Fe-Mo cluster-binding NifX family protein
MVLRSNMRIALPVSGDRFSAHFGQSTSFLVFETNDGAAQIARRWELAIPKQGGCSVIPGLLAQEGVQVVLAGGIGAGAVSRLHQHGIRTIVGIGGDDPEKIVIDFLNGQLVHSDEVCRHHERHGYGGACHGHGRHD